MMLRKCVLSAGCWVLGALSSSLPLLAQSKPMPGGPSTQHSAPSTSSVVLVVIDGARWQEVFHGGDCALMTKAQGVADTAALRASFCRADPDSAAAALMPFLHGSVT